MPTSSQPIPTVSIGLPVFNGELYLDSTIRSILGQTFSDFELIVCDNASTDRTAEICRDHASRDARIVYHRQPTNLGAGRNYDDCFHRSSGEFFKWAAHDDLLAPEYLDLSVKALQARPDAIHCTTGITEIGPEGAVLRSFANRFPGVESGDPARRFGALIHTNHQCEDFFGLYRRAALIGSGMHGTYNGSDRVLMAEMAIRGPWVHVEAPVFLHREHPNRYTRALLLKDHHEAARWQGTARQRATSLFHLRVWRNYWRAVARSAPDDRARRGCEMELLRWWFTDGHAADVARDLVRAASPHLFQALRAVKRATIGSTPPPQHGALPPAP